MGGGIEEGEHGVEMHGVTIKAVTMRPREPGQMAGRSLNCGPIKGRCFHLLAYCCVLLVYF